MSIQTIIEAVAAECGGFPEEFIGQTLGDILRDIDHPPVVIFWQLYDDATLSTVVGWEHMSKETIRAHAYWFASHGAIGQA